MSNRDITLKVNVSVEQYVALKHVAEAYGVSISWLGAKALQDVIERFHEDHCGTADLFLKSSGPVVAVTTPAKGAA